MIIKVERCRGNFRLTLPCGSREFVENRDGDWWSRSFASRALDILENVYGVKRRAVRFHHVN